MSKTPSMAEIAAFDAGRMSPEQEADFAARVQQAGNLFIPKRFARARSLTAKGQQEQAKTQETQQAAVDTSLQNFDPAVLAQMSPEQRARLARGQQLAEVARQGEVEADRAAQADRMTPVDKAGAFILGAADTMSLGLADEAAGALNVADPRNNPLVRMAMGKEVLNPAELYTLGRDEQAEVSRIAREEVAPMFYGGGSLAGILPGAVGGAGSAVARAGLAGKVMQGAKVGGGQAALQGFGEGRGLADSAQSALVQGAIGALFGAGAGGASTLATKAGREAAKAGVQQAGARAVSSVKSAAGRAVPTVASVASKIDDMDPAAKAMVAVLGGPQAIAAMGAARVLRKLAPEVADATPFIVEEAPSWLASITDDAAKAAKTSASGLELARPAGAAAEGGDDAIRSMVTREIEDLAASFEGGTAGPQTRSSVGAVGPSGVDPEAVRAQIAAIKAGTPIPTGGIQQRTAAGRRAMPQAQAPAPRRLNDDEMTALVRAKAIELGTTDAATISSAAGISSSAASQALQRLAKTFSFRDAVEKARLSRGGAPAPAPAPAASPPSRMNTQEMSALVGRPMPPGSSAVPTMAPAPPATMPPPPPELVEFFLMKGATRDQALAQAYAVMAKSFATPQGAVGRQRSAAPFSGEKPAKIATPKGRNHASAPFKKKANR
jgi:hypothetical protein